MMGRMEKTTLNFTVGFKTDIGRVREMNQDSYAILRRNELLKQLDLLLVVADGMGGGKGGEVASRITAETLPNVAHEELAEVLNGRKLDPGNILRMGMERANSQVRHKGVEQRAVSGMGTTCVAAILNDGVLTVGNAGDSRAYLLRGDKLNQITNDHSEVWQQVLEGKMTREEAQKSKFRNRISKSIGLHDEVRPDIDTFTLQEGDTFLLCSDGLTTEVTDGEIANILAAAPTAQAACDQLTDMALRKGGSDNITVVALRYGEFTPLAGAEFEAQLLPELDEEDATDERAEWRKSARQAMETTAFTAPVRNGNSGAGSDSANSRNRVNSENRNDDADDADEEDEDEDDEDEPRRRRRKRGSESEEARDARKGGFATAAILTLLCLLAVVSVALGIALYARTIVLPAPKIVKMNNDGKGGDPFNARTDKDLNYFDAVEIYPKPVRDELLQITDFDNILVVASDGKCISLTPPDEQKASHQQTVEDAYYKASKLPDPPLPPLSKLGAATKTSVKNAPALLTFDASNNRYQYDPATHSIFKWDQSGIRKRSDIGQGKLIAPTRMAVNGRGDIFLIDQHKIEVITASESTDQINTDNTKLRENKQ